MRLVFSHLIQIVHNVSKAIELNTREQEYSIFGLKSNTFMKRLIRN